jgi:NAD/NADP transhydrogenase beta subunit
MTNFINTLLGIALIYAAILNPVHVTDRHWAALTLAVAAVMFALALLSWKSTVEKWQIQTVLWLAVVLALQAVLRWVADMPVVVSVWVVFWAGILSSILSFWGMLYHPQTSGARSGGVASR